MTLIFTILNCISPLLYDIHPLNGNIFWLFHTVRGGGDILKDHSSSAPPPSPTRINVRTSLYGSQLCDDSIPHTVKNFLKSVTVKIENYCSYYPT